MTYCMACDAEIEGSSENELCEYCFKTMKALMPQIFIEQPATKPEDGNK